MQNDYFNKYFTNDKIEQRHFSDKNEYKSCYKKETVEDNHPKK